MTNDKEYFNLLERIKAAYLSSQQQAAMAVNSQMLYAYWQIGLTILSEQEKQGWGAKVIDTLAKDLSLELPHVKGFSRRNLIYMQKFASEWPQELFVQQPAAQIQNTENEQTKIVQQPIAQFKEFENHPISRVPWSHHLLLLDKLKTSEKNSH